VLTECFFVIDRVASAKAGRSLPKFCFQTRTIFSGCLKGRFCDRGRGVSVEPGHIKVPKPHTQNWLSSISSRTATFMSRSRNVSNCAARHIERFGISARRLHKSQYAAAWRNNLNWFAVAFEHEVLSATRCVYHDLMWFSASPRARILRRSLRRKARISTPLGRLAGRSMVVRKRTAPSKTTIG
jgi:hypothetical protein